MSDRFHSAVARALDANDIMARLGKAMDGFGVALGVVGLGVAVRSHLHWLAVVAKIPGLVADIRAERPHLERHRIARVDVEGRSIAGVDCRRELLLLIFVEDLYDGEI